MMAYRKLGSSLRRSGQKPVGPGTQAKPGVGDRIGPGANVVLPTTEPALRFGIVLGERLSPGVIPPRPLKYGTSACRYPYSARNVMYCRGIQSNVSEASHALKGSPGFCVKYGDPEMASAPLIGGSSGKYRPGLSIAPPPSVIAYKSFLNHQRL